MLDHVHHRFGGYLTGTEVKVLRLLLIFLTGAVLSTGCSALRARFRFPAKAAPPTAVQKAGGALLDSIWSAPLAVDTVVLEPRAAGETLPAQDTGEYRRGPAAVEVGDPAQRWGYRVQLASADRKEDLEKFGPRIQREFGEPVLLEQHDSLFTLRIGAFLRLDEAEAERTRAVSYGYKYAWIVQTLIALHELNHKE